MAEVTEVQAEQAQSAAAPADDVILQAKNITKIFPGTVALDSVDFNVYRGKVNVLVGENGAGKSTLMKIVAGVEEPTSGKLLLEGKEIKIKSTRDAARHGIGESDKCTIDLILSAETFEMVCIDGRQYRECRRHAEKRPVIFIRLHHDMRAISEPNIRPERGNHAAEDDGGIISRFEHYQPYHGGGRRFAVCPCDGNTLSLTDECRQEIRARDSQETAGVRLGQFRIFA